MERQGGRRRWLPMLLLLVVVVAAMGFAAVRILAANSPAEDEAVAIVSGLVDSDYRAVAARAATSAGTELDEASVIDQWGRALQRYGAAQTVGRPETRTPSPRGHTVVGVPVTFQHADHREVRVFLDDERRLVSFGVFAVPPSAQPSLLGRVATIGGLGVVLPLMLILQTWAQRRRRRGEEAGSHHGQGGDAGAFG